MSMSKQEAEIRLDEHLNNCAYCHPHQKHPYFCNRYEELAKLAGKESE